MPDASRAKQPVPKKRATAKTKVVGEGKSPSLMIDERIRELGDWRGEMLSQIRTLIRQADADAVEEWK